MRKILAALAIGSALAVALPILAPEHAEARGFVRFAARDHGRGHVGNWGHRHRNVVMFNRHRRSNYY
jgi:hypothetical protein